jgi:GNAT superfamily N-acetyltransferase
MSGSRVATQLDVRPYEDADEPRVLELLSASLGAGPSGDRSAAFFRWKHLENPFGRSVLLVAEADGGIVGLRAFLRWRLRAGHRELSAVRAVDTATHPEFQGRGIFSRLTRAARPGRPRLQHAERQERAGLSEDGVARGGEDPGVDPGPPTGSLRAPGPNPSLGRESGSSRS